MENLKIAVAGTGYGGFSMDRMLLHVHNFKTFSL